MYVPEGFAHGFAVLSERAVVCYKCGEFYDPAAEQTILWNDTDLAIEWPIADPPLCQDRVRRL
jgi:dTDP-4-dehydrorhamnose 3,5-epimerase